MNHILDNPAWNALNTGSRLLGYKSERSAYFEPTISPFAALAEPTQECLDDLYKTVPFSDFVVLVSNQKVPISDDWRDVLRVPAFQMIYSGSGDFEPGDIATEPLTLAHVPEMLVLTKLTNPGPFLPRTIEFGHYEGVFVDDRLVAMAGQRMHPAGFAEVSAVCTHPDYLGKKYAQTLMMRQVRRILDAGETPFLHAKADNSRAITLYQHLGFEIRSDIYFCGMRKAE